MEYRKAGDGHAPALFFAGHEAGGADIADQFECDVVMDGTSDGLQVDFHGQDSRLDRAVAAQVVSVIRHESRWLPRACGD